MSNRKEKEEESVWFVHFQKSAKEIMEILTAGRKQPSVELRRDPDDASCTASRGRSRLHCSHLTRRSPDPKN